MVMYNFLFNPFQCYFSVLFIQNGWWHFYLSNTISLVLPFSLILAYHVEKDPEMGATEKLYVWDGVLKEDVNMALLLGEGGHQKSFLFC